MTALATPINPGESVMPPQRWEQTQKLALVVCPLYLLEPTINDLSSHLYRQSIQTRKSGRQKPQLSHRYGMYTQLALVDSIYRLSLQQQQMVQKKTMAAMVNISGLHIYESICLDG